MLIEKLPDASDLVNPTVLNAKISEVENKISDNCKYTTTQEINKSIAENFAASLKQANLVNQTDFDNKQIRFNRQITSNKIKLLEVQMRLNRLITKNYNFFSGRICFASNDESQNTFVYQPTLDALELKKVKGTDYVISFKSN